MTSFSRHSGVGRNPVQEYDSRNAGQDLGFVRYAAILFLLDSGLRRITSDLPACGLSRMASSSFNDGILSFMENIK
jgi:hypothetical protein